MKSTTIRFADNLYRQLEGASKVTGLPVNSIVVVCPGASSGISAGIDPGALSGAKRKLCDSWVATLIAWWIDQETGYPIAERSGVVRWVARFSRRAKRGCEFAQSRV